MGRALGVRSLGVIPWPQLRAASQGWRGLGRKLLLVLFLSGLAGRRGSEPRAPRNALSWGLGSGSPEGPLQPDYGENPGTARSGQVTKLGLRTRVLRGQCARPSG